MTDGSGEAGVEVADLRALLDLLRDTDLVELEVERDGLRVCIRRDPPRPARRAPAASGAADVHTGQRDAHPENGVVDIPSAWVGIFHASVRPGDEVSPGQAVGTVEALRMRHAVEAECGGVVEAVLVGDGHAVEYGQPLVRLRQAP